jgi:hypothetical protein
MNTLFRGRRYENLSLEGENIDTVLGRAQSILGSTLFFDFSHSNRVPSVTITYQDGSVSPSYILLRSNGNGLFNPLPADRRFINRDELSSSGNITSTINADVENRSGITVQDPRFTFAALYIVAVGMDENYSYIYSTPALIHVFQLPEP